MPHRYPAVGTLEGVEKKGDGNCVALVQTLTKVGTTDTWRAGDRVMDMASLARGTVIATFLRGRYPNKKKGNHAALYMYSGPTDPETRKPMYIVVMDQWTDKRRISARSIYARGNKPKSEGNYYDDSDNADMFYVVK